METHKQSRPQPCFRLYWCSCLLLLLQSTGTAPDTSARAALAQSISFCTVGAPLNPAPTNNFPLHFNGKAPPPRCYTRKVGDPRHKRRVALDKVEKLLRRD